MAKDIPVESIDQMMALAQEYFPGVEVLPPLEREISGEDYVVVYAYYPPQNPQISTLPWKRSVYAKRHADRMIKEYGQPRHVRPGTYNYL